jgi:hypothetical protein
MISSERLLEFNLVEKELQKNIGLIYSELTKIDEYLEMEI